MKICEVLLHGLGDAARLYTRCVVCVGVICLCVWCGLSGATTCVGIHRGMYMCVAGWGEGYVQHRTCAYVFA